MADYIFPIKGLYFLFYYVSYIFVSQSNSWLTAFETRSALNERGIVKFAIFYPCKVYVMTVRHYGKTACHGNGE